jgi:hypothetical protein
MELLSGAFRCHCVFTSAFSTVLGNKISSQKIGFIKRIESCFYFLNDIAPDTGAGSEG